MKQQDRTSIFFFKSNRLGDTDMLFVKKNLELGVTLRGYIYLKSNLPEFQGR
jgi:hypothetical protein